jgi:hypothetical protein
MDVEVWKEVYGYEGRYEVSNFGRVKSLSYNKTKVEKILSPMVNPETKYLSVNLYNKGKTQYHVHTLVAIAFLNFTPCDSKLMINHINGIRDTNFDWNLEIVTNRYNTNDGYSRKETSSIYTGVCFDKRKKNWKACIWVNGKSKYLGNFINEIDAANAYQIALEQI